MNLLIDVGNTNIKAVLDDGHSFVPVTYDPKILSEYPLKNITYACVGDSSELAPLISSAHALGISIREVCTESVADGVVCGYVDHTLLGVDRWLGVIAGFELSDHSPTIIVDLGTATTVDFVDEDGMHHGGWIVPGISLMEDSIRNKARKVFSDGSTGYKKEAGTSTPAALKNGCLNAQLGLIERAVNVFRCQNIILTGGAAKYVLPHLSDFNTRFEPDLLFHGLRFYAKD